MPELPDVEVFKRYIDSTSLHHRITDMNVTDFYVLKNIGRDSFERRFDGRRAMIKSALMNQDIIAGIGNVYSDEILFRAELHPKSKVPHISDNDWKNIYEAMQNVCETAIDCNVEKDCFPNHFILSNRQEGADCPKGCNGTLRSSTVSGRTAYYCPKCQQDK